MASRTPLRIKMLAREVIARGAPFRAWGPELADAGVALDEISTLRPHVEPLLLRVIATGGKAKERAAVQGDWLCRADGSAPSLVPPILPSWDYERAAALWSQGRTWLNAWEHCIDPRWMLRAAITVGLKVRPGVAVACACLRVAASWARLGHDASAALDHSLDVGEQWASGDASVLHHELRGARNAASLTGNRDLSDDYARMLAYGISDVCEAANLSELCKDYGPISLNLTGPFAANGDAVAAHLASAVNYAVSSVRNVPHPPHRSRDARQADAIIATGLMADAVRSNIPSLMILEAVIASRSESNL